MNISDTKAGCLQSIQKYPHPFTSSRCLSACRLRISNPSTKDVFKPSDMYRKYLNIGCRMAVYCRVHYLEHCHQMLSPFHCPHAIRILGGNGRTFIVRRAFEQSEASTTGRGIINGEVFHISNPYIGLLVDAGFDATNAVWHDGFCRRERHPISSRLVSQDAKLYNCKCRGALW